MNHESEGRLRVGSQWARKEMFPPTSNERRCGKVPSEERIESWSASDSGELGDERRLRSRRERERVEERCWKRVVSWVVRSGMEVESFRKRVNERVRSEEGVGRMLSSSEGEIRRFGVASSLSNRRCVSFSEPSKTKASQRLTSNPTSPTHSNSQT